MDGLDKKIESYKEKGLDLLAKLIACPSVLDEYRPDSEIPFGKGAREALDTLLAYAKEDGFITGNVDNYAGYVDFGSGKETLGILAHLDVVPVTLNEWKTDPFKLTIMDGKMYARGSEDDKGPLVASYIAMKMLLDEGYEPKRRVRLIAGCDEETGSRCLERYLEKMGEPEIAFSPDAEFPAIYGEKAIMSYDITGNLGEDIILTMNAGERYNVVPSRAEMTLKTDLKKEYIDYLKKNNYRGEVDGDKYIAYGIASHGSMPSHGLNAIYILFDFLVKNSDSKLAKFMNEYYLWDTEGKKAGYYEYDPEMLGLTSNLAIAEVHDGTIRFGVNCRCPLDDSFENIPAALANITAKYGYSYQFLGGSPRHFVPKDSELVSKLVGVYRKVTGDMREPITIGGGTYAREMKNAIAFGPVLPDEPDLCHISNEYMTVADFIGAIKIYYLAIKELTE